jgi:hypothetical protein
MLNSHSNGQCVSLIGLFNIKGKEMFEAGKKYVVGQGTPVATCLYADDLTVVMRYDGNKHVLNSQPINFVKSGWVEYVEPKVLTTELFVRSDGAEIWLNDGSISKKYPDNNTIGKIRITHVEGSGLAVEVVG